MGVGVELGSSKAEQSAPNLSISYVVPSHGSLYSLFSETQIVTANILSSEHIGSAARVHHLRFQNLSGFSQHSAHPSLMKSGIELFHSCADLERQRPCLFQSENFFSFSIHVLTCQH